MPSTTKFSAKNSGIPQHGTYWCIPASIENLLRSEGINDLTQEQLIHSYLAANVPVIPTNNGATVALSSLPKHVILEIFRCPAIPSASFQTFAPITNSLLQQRGSNIQLEYVSNIKSDSDYVQELQNMLSQNKPVLISAKNQNDFHITVVYEYDGTHIYSYDPGQDMHLKELASQYSFSNDLLFLK